MNICIFCGSNAGNSESIRKDIVLICELVSNYGFDLVFGGSDYGTMGLVADVFRKNGRKIVGIRPEKFIKNEKSSRQKNELIFTKTMSERKSKMLEISDVIVAFPGL
ncbi:MAG: LOG family protein [Flavobacteriia bacterium]|nr:LOG family protein [Flavobacteriia bacterium]MBH2024933.1 LOG family protein [Flavobacteriales bacterium]